MTRPHTGPALRRLARLGVTAGFVAASAAAVALGSALVAGGKAPGLAASPSPVPVSVLPVQIEPGYRVTRRFVGQIEAAAQADLGFELAGRITQVLAEEGDTVAAGAVLARLDTTALVPERAALEADLAAAAADAERARLTRVRSDALAERGFRAAAAQDEARLALARAEAGMAALRARIAAVDVRLDKSVLVAPFAGRIGARMADPGQTVAPGQPVLTLFDAAPPQLRVGLPEPLAATLRPGQTLPVEVGGQRREAVVLHLRPDLDPATRTRAVLVALPAGTGAALGGTGVLVLAQHIAEPGFRAPLTALREGARGSWSVLAVEATPQGDTVRSVAVEVLHVDGAGVFLRAALPAGARIVAEAPDRVVPGQPVAPLPAGPGGS